MSNMGNCRDCSNLTLITGQGDFERRCKERLNTRYGDHECEKYNRLMPSCSYCE